MSQLNSGWNFSFNTALGVYEAESPDVNISAPSPQQRLVSKTESFEIPIFKGKSDFCFVLRKFRWKLFSCQAQQDCRLTIRLGNKKFGFISGKYAPTTISDDFLQPDFISENRAIAQTGMPYNAISSVTGIGFPDNFPKVFDDLFVIAYESENVSVIVENQSAVYDHAIEISWYGWSFPSKGRSRKEIIDGEMARLARERCLR